MSAKPTLESTVAALQQALATDDDKAAIQSIGAFLTIAFSAFERTADAAERIADALEQRNL